MSALWKLMLDSFGKLFLEVLRDVFSSPGRTTSIEDTPGSFDLPDADIDDLLRRYDGVLDPGSEGK